MANQRYDKRHIDFLESLAAVMATMISVINCLMVYLLNPNIGTRNRSYKIYHKNG